MQNMDYSFLEEERNLSGSESVIMKAIWDAKEDISIPDLIEKLRNEYGKDYARTTVVTFLLKMSDKGFVRTYRKGKLSFAHIMKSEEEYRRKVLNDALTFWYGGDSELFKQDVEQVIRERREKPAVIEE